MTKSLRYSEAKLEQFDSSIIAPPKKAPNSNFYRSYESNTNIQQDYENGRRESVGKQSLAGNMESRNDSFAFASKKLLKMNSNLQEFDFPQI